MKEVEFQKRRIAYGNIRQVRGDLRCTSACACDCSIVPAFGTTTDQSRYDKQRS